MWTADSDFVPDETLSMNTMYLVTKDGLARFRSMAEMLDMYPRNAIITGIGEDEDLEMDTGL